MVIQLNYLEQLETCYKESKKKTFRANAGLLCTFKQLGMQSENFLLINPDFRNAQVTLTNSMVWLIMRLQKKASHGTVRDMYTGNVALPTSESGSHPCIEHILMEIRKNGNNKINSKSNS